MEKQILKPIRSKIAAVLLAGVTIAVIAPFTTAMAATYSSEQLAERALHRRSVEAANWGMPLVNFFAMREALKRDAGVGFNDVAYHSRTQNWKLQFTTNNGSSPYVHIHWNLKDGPVVLELPAFAGSGINLFGTLLDAWQRPLDDVGNDGLDRGRGGKYLMLPPGYQGTIPPGYMVLQQETLNGYTLLRAIIPDNNPATFDRVVALIKKIRVYSLAQAANPPATRHIDIYDKLIDGVAKYDASFFDSLNAMIQEEPVETRDIAMMGLLRTLGIGKGQPFKPDAAQRKVLDAAAAEAGEYMLDFTLNSLPLFYGPGNHWRPAVSRSGIQTAFTWQLPGYLDVDARAGAYRVAYTSMKRIGVASFYLLNAHDQEGKRLDGGASYKLTVPANVPVGEFWSVIPHDDYTSAWFKNQPRGNLDSLDTRLRKNSDGSVDVYFGPEAPTGKERNWLPTEIGKTYFLLFRFYSPKAAVFDRSFKLNEMERLN